MEFRKLKVEDTKMFCDLIVDMYSHLENLEWFTPMPYDYDNVKSMIENPRFYILGVFDKEDLVAVTSLDYKCGKLIGKYDFPKFIDTNKLVEIGFNIVKHSHQGQGIMKLMVSKLIQKIKDDGFDYAFAKVHKDNIASQKSLEYNGFKIDKPYSKGVDIIDFKELSSQPFFSKVGYKNAQVTLSKYSTSDTKIIVDYNVLIKKIN